MAFPDSFMQELKSRSDIREIVGDYVDLKRRGKSYLGLCPFHNEKTPSFNVNADQGYFHCFGCGAGGDVISFVERIENLDYVEAVKFLAQRAGLTVPESNVDDSMSKLRLRIKEINRETARFYHSVLNEPAGEKGLDYFRRRGLSNKTIRHFGLGFSPEEPFALVNHLKELKYTEYEMIAANVAFQTRSGRAKDRFNGRAMFPIIDLTGNVVAFGGRALGDEKPKYINTSDTPVYKKSQGLFAMNFAKNAGTRTLILAEGYMDVISLHAAGFQNAIASLGTALTEEQAKIISRYADEVVICYDSDAAGQKAAERAIPILRRTGLHIRVMAVPGNKDPDEFMRSEGKDGPAKFKALVDKSGNDVNYRLSKIRAQYNLETPDGKTRYVSEACELIAGIDNEIERSVYAGEIARECLIETGLILNRVKKILSQNRKEKVKKDIRDRQRELQGYGQGINQEKRNNVMRTNAEENLIRYLVNYPEDLSYVKAKLSADDFSTAFTKKLFAIVSEKVEATGRVDVSDFSAELSMEEMNSFVKMLEDGLTAYSKQDVNTAIDIIKRNGNKTNEDSLKNMSDDDTLRMMAELRKSKH